MEVEAALKANMAQFKRGRDTSLPNHPLKASEVVRMQLTRALAKLHEFYSDPAIQEKHARRFMKTPEYVESDAPSPPPVDNAKNSSVGQGRQAVVISSDLTSFEDDDPNEIDGYEQDMMGTNEEEEIDEEEAFRMLTEDLGIRLKHSTTFGEENDKMDDGEEEKENKAYALATEDEGVEADEESEGEDNYEDCSLPTSEDQPFHNPQLLSSQSDKGEEEYRGRNRYRKRLNGHTDRSSVSSFEVRPPLKKKAKVISTVDSDEAMEDEHMLRGTSEEREGRREQLLTELMLPPLTRICKRYPG